MVTKSRPLAFPAADAEVRVVSLREDPRVAAGDDAELEHELAAIPLVERCIPFERDAVPMVAAEAERARRDPVDPVGADDHVGAHSFAADRDRAVVERDRDTVAKLGACLRGLAREELVEAPPLRQEAERLLAPADERRAVVESKLEPVRDVLDNRVDGERK